MQDYGFSLRHTGGQTKVVIVASFRRRRQIYSIEGAQRKLLVEGATLGVVPSSRRILLQLFPLIQRLQPVGYSCGPDRLPIILTACNHISCLALFGNLVLL